MKKQSIGKSSEALPMFKTVEQMARISGIGENTIRRLIEQGQLEYFCIGNRKLLLEQAVFDWYARNCVRVINHVTEKRGA